MMRNLIVQSRTIQINNKKSIVSCFHLVEHLNTIAKYSKPKNMMQFRNKSERLKDLLICKFKGSNFSKKM